MTRSFMRPAPPRVNDIALALCTSRAPIRLTWEVIAHRAATDQLFDQLRRQTRREMLGAAVAPAPRLRNSCRKSDPTHASSFFYGWLIVAVVFVTMAIGVNARTAFSLLFPPILDEFGWDRGVTAGAFSFGFVVSAIAEPAARPHDGSPRARAR